MEGGLIQRNFKDTFEDEAGLLSSSPPTSRTRRQPRNQPVESLMYSMADNSFNMRDSSNLSDLFFTAGASMAPGSGAPRYMQQQQQQHLPPHMQASLMGTTFLDNSNSSLQQASSPAGSYGAAAQTSTNRQQRQNIAMFSSMAMGKFQEGLSTLPPPAPNMAKPTTASTDQEPHSSEPSVWDSEEDYFYDAPSTFWEHVAACFNPTPYLVRDLKFTDDGDPYFDDNWGGWSPGAMIRHLFFNPLSPEFTSLQQFSWAVTIGIAMGFYTAIWKYIIETCVEFVWEKLPEFLLEKGVFTELDGAFPLYHYMWICPSIFGGVLSWIFVVLPVKIPDQNEWIRNVHIRGVQEFKTFWPLFVLSTAAMASGMSLGPELPLVLTAGMAGSWLSIVCKQSILQARVMNLTAASAAVAGFFGFPMAGALFVLGTF